MELSEAVRTAVELLGKSERDPEILRFIGLLGVDGGIGRPKRGGNQVNIEIGGSPLELAFVDHADYFDDADRFSEGELVLAVVFLHVEKFAAGRDLPSDLPFGLDLRMSRSDARTKFGTPGWTSPVMKNDRWQFDGNRVLLCFSADEKNLRQISISLQPIG